MIDIAEQVTNEIGISTELCLTPEELSMIQAMIYSQYIRVLRSKLKYEVYKRIEHVPMEDYHCFAHFLKHNQVWVKEKRILHNWNVADIRQMPFMKKLEELFGKFKITNEEGYRREEIYWRIVRPFRFADIGTIHADKWFWELGHGKRPGKTCIKVWIPICIQSGRSGLQVVPHSHLRDDWQYRGVRRPGETRANFLKPVIDERIEYLNPILLNTEPGRIVLFNDAVLHGGILNTSNKTRISMEFMLYVD